MAPGRAAEGAAYRGAWLTEGKEGIPSRAWARAPYVPADRPRLCSLDFSPSKLSGSLGFGFLLNVLQKGFSQKDQSPCHHQPPQILLTCVYFLLGEGEWQWGVTLGGAGWPHQHLCRP